MHWKTRSDFMDRRQFLKTAALASAGAAVYFSGAHLYLTDERWTPNRSYWVSRGRALMNSPLQGDHSADLAVIGGGVTGLSTAIHVREIMPKLRVVLLEAEYIGYGATGRSGGILANGTSAATPEGTEDSVGYSIGLINRLGIKCDLDPEKELLDPYKYAVGLKAAAEQAGVQIFESTRVVDIDKGNPARLAGDGFSLKAPRVIVATNGYMPMLGIGAEHIFPVHTGVAVTTPMPKEKHSALLQIINDPETDIWGRGTPEQRMLMGSGAEYYYDNGLYDTSHRRLFPVLRRYMTNQYPELIDYPYEFTWTGPLGMTQDQEPVIGAVGKDKNILYCGGYSALGLALGTLAGRWLAGMLDGDAPPDWLFRDMFRFPNEPLRYIGVNSAINLMNLGVW
jgi:glycine/D-amino acid oxidase-like deaminating enzyme